MNNIHHTHIPLSPIHNIISTHNTLPVPPTPKKGYKEYYIHEKKKTMDNYSMDNYYYVDNVHHVKILLKKK